MNEKYTWTHQFPLSNGASHMAQLNASSNLLYRIRSSISYHLMHWPFCAPWFWVQTHVTLANIGSQSRSSMVYTGSKQSLTPSSSYVKCILHSLVDMFHPHLLLTYFIRMLVIYDAKERHMNSLCDYDGNNYASRTLSV